MSVSETFHGYIETTQDSLLVFEACRRNILPKVSRRLQEKERKMVRSGSVFVFDEKDSGIKRWTDGLVWSPSRILGNFLVYRELNKRPTAVQKQQQQTKRRSNTETLKTRQVLDLRNNKHLVGSLSELYNFKEKGLIKKTFSLVVNGVPLHLVSYYHPDDVLEHHLRTPSAVPELANLDISPELLSKQNFRIPPMVEPDTQPQPHHSVYTFIPHSIESIQSAPNTSVSNRSLSTPSLKSTSIHSLLSSTPPQSQQPQQRMNISAFTEQPSFYV